MSLASSITIAAALCATVLNTSCGKWAKASPESVNTMNRPEYPTVANDVFTLNSSKSQVSYNGTLFIANPNATVTDFAALINASVDSRERWADLKKFQVDTNYHETFKNIGAPATEQLSLMLVGLSTFEAEALKKTPLEVSERIANATNLIEKEIALLNLPPDKLQAFEASWGHYCEAKVIELATHPVLTKNTFANKPSPTSLCDKYYAANAYFTSPDCTSETGDYLKCLWVDGVAKTRWFTPTSDVTEAAIIEAKKDKREKLEALFSDINYEATKNSLAFNTVAYADNAEAKTFVTKADQFVTIATTQGVDEKCKLALATESSKTLCSLFSLSKEKYSPKQVIEAMEGVKRTTAIVAVLPAPAGRDFTVQAILQYVNRRLNADASESDRLFLEPNANVTWEAPKFSSYTAAVTSKVTDIRSFLAQEFYGKLSDADLEIRKTKLQAIERQNAYIEFHNLEYNRLNDMTTQASNHGIEVANRPGFGVGFLNYGMLYTQVDNIVSVEINFKAQDDLAFRACMDLNTRSNIACPESFPPQGNFTFLPAALNWAADGGKLELSIPLTNVAENGFGPKARHTENETPDFFMDLPAEETEGKVLRFEFYRNRLLDQLDIMTGKAFIEDGAKQLYEGAVSVWENLG